MGELKEKPDSTTKKEVFFKYAFGKAAGRRFRGHIDRRVSQTGGIRPEKSVYTLNKERMQRKGVQNKMAKQKKIDLEHMTEKEKMKYEIADELGLYTAC